MSVIPNLRPTPYGRCDNIIYIALEPYFIDYDYRYDDLEVFRDTYRHICLINEYVAWIYDFEWHWDLTKPFQAIVTGLIE